MRKLLTRAWGQTARPLALDPRALCVALRLLCGQSWRQGVWGAEGTGQTLAQPLEGAAEGGAWAGALEETPQQPP